MTLSEPVHLAVTSRLSASAQPCPTWNSSHNGWTLISSAPTSVQCHCWRWSRSGSTSTMTACGSYADSDHHVTVTSITSSACVWRRFVADIPSWYSALPRTDARLWLWPSRRSSIVWERDVVSVGSVKRFYLLLVLSGHWFNLWSSYFKISWQKLRPL